MGFEKLGKLVITKASQNVFKTCGKDLAKSTKISLFEKAIKQTKKIKSKKLSKNEIIKLSEETFKRRSRSLQPKFIESLNGNFETKKARLIEEYLKIGEKGIAKHLSKATTPEQVSKILVKHDLGYLQKLTNQSLKYSLTESGKTKPLTLELEQLLYEGKMHRGRLILAREKALHLSSTKPDVIAAENILKKEYGCKFVSLKDNEDIAKQVLKAFETAKKNKAPLPKNVIVSDNMFAEGENLFNGTILLNSKPQAWGDMYCSTTSDYHTVLHEILHSSHPDLLSFSHMKIPKKFMDVKQNLSTYSATSLTHETFTELNTKRMLEGLSPEEQELFNCLNYLA